MKQWQEQEALSRFQLIEPLLQEDLDDAKRLQLRKQIAQESIADFRRKKLLETGIRRSNGNLKYLTPEEAAMMAKVSRTMIVYWYRRGEFPIIHIGNRVRIRRKEFESWLLKREERGKVDGIYRGKES